MISLKRIARAAHPNAAVCWRVLGQRHLVMADALERRRVLARPHSSLSCADKHPKASACQVISGNLIVVCLFIALAVLPPNQRVQSTPLRGHKIVRILETGFGLIVIPL